MDFVLQAARSLGTSLAALPGVTDCRLTGSLAGPPQYRDAYSDIDFELDVSGCDNSLFARRLPQMIAKEYPLIFFDYARGRMPASYIVTLALFQERPFQLVDIRCTACPHCASVGKEGFPQDKTAHTAKLFVVNLKHFIRGGNCSEDIARMYWSILPARPAISPAEQLRSVYAWLCGNAVGLLPGYLKALRPYIPLIK